MVLWESGEDMVLKVASCSHKNHLHWFIIEQINFCCYFFSSSFKELSDGFDTEIDGGR